MIASLACHLLNGLGEDLHVLHRTGVAQLDRPLPVLACAAKARGHALSVEVYVTKLLKGLGLILRRGLLEPWPRLRVVHIDTVAVVVHHAEHILAHRVTPLGSDLERRHHSRVVDRHAEAPVVPPANVPGCLNVALVQAE
jgi:hypothetical protein